MKIRDLIRSVTELGSDDELILNKTIEMSVMVTVVRAIFYENNKYYPQVLLDECLYEI